MKKRIGSRKILTSCFALLTVVTVARFWPNRLHAGHYAVNRAPINALMSNAYGSVIARDQSSIPGAIVEKVAIYSQKDYQEPHQRVERTGMLVRYPHAKGTILICHGFMCDKYDTGFLRQLFNAGEYNIMTFDFRGHGEKRDNQHCTLGQNEAYDVIASAHFLKEHENMKGLPLIAYGFSMGAVAAIEAQAKDSMFAGLILDCPFSSSERLIYRGIDQIKYNILGYTFDLPGKSVLQKYAFHPYIQSMVKMVLKVVSKLDSKDVNLFVPAFHPVESVRKISAPCLFIHCKNDELVPENAVNELFNGAKGYKRLWLTNGRKHYDSFFYNPERYVYQVREFVHQVVEHTLPMLRNGEVAIDAEDIFNPEKAETNFAIN